MTLRPKAPKDMMLAPVAAAIDLNLQPLRDKSTTEIAQTLAIALNIDPAGRSPAERADWVLEEALRAVELHDWHGEITGDFARLRLSGGSVSIELGLSASLQRYIESGP